MKKLMFAALFAAGCVPNTTYPGDPATEPDPEPDPGPGNNPGPEPCEAGAFLDCAADLIETCSADGITTTSAQCAAGCNPEAARCNECVPDTAECTGSEVQTCGADGLVAATESCMLACAEPGGTAHCTHIVPAFLPTVCDALATAPTLVIPSGQQNVIDTDNAATCNGGIVGQAGGPEICVVRYGTISVEGPLEVVGRRAIAFVADGSLDVDNGIDISARGRASGPGGGNRVSGEAPTRAGGGGAGGKQVGGKGGGVTNDEFLVGNLGGALVDPITTQIFEGGSHAGSAAQVTGNYRPQGGGVVGPDRGAEEHVEEREDRAVVAAEALGVVQAVVGRAHDESVERAERHAG